MAKKKEYTENIKREAKELIIEENTKGLDSVVKNKGGRPKIVIDYSMVERLARIMCTKEEIASFLDLDVRTLERDSEFCRVYKRNLDTGKISLRRSQMKLADNGNATMNIWLGKQYLGQTDKIESKNENTDTNDKVFNKLKEALKNV